MQLVAFGAQDRYLMGDMMYSETESETDTEIFLDSIPYCNEMSSSECPICLCGYETDSEVHVTQCNHIFHHQCLSNYLESDQHIKSYNCPLCRTANNIHRK